MNKKLLRQYINEALVDRGFVKHMQTGLRYARGDRSAEAQQIVSDWLEDVELKRENLFSPGHVFRIERFVAQEWPVVLDRFHGDERMALITMHNVLDSKYNDLK